MNTDCCRDNKIKGDRTDPTVMKMKILSSFLYAVLASFYTSPATGDDSRPWLWAVIAGVAVVLVVVLVVIGKKGGKDDDGE